MAYKVITIRKVLTNVEKVFYLNKISDRGSVLIFNRYYCLHVVWKQG